MYLQAWGQVISKASGFGVSQGFPAGGFPFGLLSSRPLGRPLMDSLYYWGGWGRPARERLLPMIWDP